MAVTTRILYVDESPTDCEQVRAALAWEQHSCQVTLVMSREDFINHLGNGNYDLVLCSCTMPHIDIASAISLMQASNLHAPVIVITDLASEERAIEAIACGASDYIIKTPYYFQRLPIIVRTAIEENLFRLRSQQTEAALEQARKTLERLQQPIAERRQATQRLQDSATKFYALTETLPVAIIIAQVLSQNLHIRYVNPATEAITGYTREELLSMSSWYALYPDHPHILDYHYLICSDFTSAQIPARYELQIRTKQQEDRWITLSVAGIEFEGQPAILGTAFDITERKQTEAALEEERALLTRRVAERTADLSAANAELTRAARLKDEFLASMSHELRTPLHAILGLSEALQEATYGSLNLRQQQSLRHIEDSGQHLLTLINDILDLSKIGAGKLTLDINAISVEAVCKASLRLIQPEIHKKHLKVSVSFDDAVTTIQADKRRLKQILVNLLSNAVKFTPEGGSIGLEAHGDAHSNIVALTVWDTGIGISQEDMTQLFQPFVQLDGRLSKQHSGTGLGLALVYRMVEMHGGSISVQSDVDQGSRFTVTLPWESSSAIEYHDPQTPRPDLTMVTPSRYCAFVVEDSVTTADQIERYLKEMEIEVFVFSRGTGVITQMLDLHPDLLILDLHLPDMAGWDILMQMKADQRIHHIPTLIVSVEDEQARMRNLTATKYLVKPISRQQFQGAVQHLLSIEPTIASPVGVTKQPQQHQKPAMVLLVDDNKEHIDFFSDSLLSEGYTVVIARNGAEAVAHAQEMRPDIILMDMLMPELDGLEATRQIRADKDLANTPIIIITALGMPGDLKHCFDAGANDYLSKPVSFQMLHTAIATHIQRK